MISRNQTMIPGIGRSEVVIEIYTDIWLLPFLIDKSSFLWSISMGHLYHSYVK